MASYIIGVDVGYGNTKTAHSCFSSGIKLLSSKPPISTRVIETTSGFYTIGNGKLSIQSSKTEDENMRALTMAGIAEELKRTHTTVADVYLGCGVPLTRMGAEKQAFLDYYNKNRRMVYKYEDVTYSVNLLSVDVFPQGYAGVVAKLPELKKSVVIVDIGSWTIEILPIENYVPDLTRCKSLTMGTITCMNDINEALRQNLGKEADESTIKEIMMYGTSDIPAEYLSIIKSGLRDYVTSIMDTLRALNFNPDLTQFVFIAGGASIMKHFLPESFKRNCVIIHDVHINAKGYENLIRKKMGGRA